MLSDEEEILIKKLRYCEQEYEQNGYLSVGTFKAIKEAINLIEKQSKEIELLKENNKKITDEYLIQRDLINPDFLKDYISKEESEQKERKAYIKGTNDADELCNKKWEDKIKAKIGIRKDEKEICKDSIEEKYLLREIYVLQSLLEKE